MDAKKFLSSFIFPPSLGEWVFAYDLLSMFIIHGGIDTSSEK